MKKAKVVRKPRAKVVSKAEYVEHIRKMKAELEGAQQIISAMQTQLQIIDNLSTKIRDVS